MTDEASHILDAARKLPSAERAELAAILADSIGDGASPEQIQAAWLAEAKRRLAAYERGELEAVDYDDMMRRLRATGLCLNALLPDELGPLLSRWTFDAPVMEAFESKPTRFA